MYIIVVHLQHNNSIVLFLLDSKELWSNNLENAMMKTVHCLMCWMNIANDNKFELYGLI